MKNTIEINLIKKRKPFYKRPIRSSLLKVLVDRLYAFEVVERLFFAESNADRIVVWIL